MYPTAEQTAAVIAVILKRSNQTRARLSALTVKKIARRRHLRSAFVVELKGALEDAYQWQLIELNSGGFGLIQGKALEAAKSVTGKKFLDAAERKSLVRGSANYGAFHREVVGDEEEDDEDDEG